MFSNSIEQIPKAVIFIGLQASGKTTFYQQYFSSAFVHINLDTLHTRNKEANLLKECFLHKNSFVVDNTNPTISDRIRYIPLAKNYNYSIEGYFFQSVIADCIERNCFRSGKTCVPNQAIAATSRRLELPSYKEGFDHLYFVKIKNHEFFVEPWEIEFE